jgi:enamine deaminase RidA (YjgF/YER057c/UK114 family)
MSELPPPAGQKPIQPEGWAPPTGYSHGVSASGRMIVLAGQIGWNPETASFESDDFAEQVRQTLTNIVTLLAEGGASPSQLVRLTWFITDRDEYIAARRETGAAYREVIGNHYPPMSVIVVSALIEKHAKVEIEATAIVPE